MAHIGVEISHLHVFEHLTWGLSINSERVRFLAVKAQVLVIQALVRLHVGNMLVLIKQVFKVCKHILALEWLNLYLRYLSKRRVNDGLHSPAKSYISRVHAIEADKIFLDLICFFDGSFPHFYLCNG